MWIRSQDKEVLVKATSVNVYDNEENNTYDIECMNENCTNGVDDYWLLGKYKSKERAIEVLNDIEASIAVCEVAKTTDTIKAVVNTLNEKQFASVAVGMFIYQMPEE